MVFLAIARPFPGWRLNPRFPRKGPVLPGAIKRNQFVSSVTSRFRPVARITEAQWRGATAGAVECAGFAGRSGAITSWPSSWGLGMTGPSDRSRLCGPPLWSPPMSFAATRRAFVYGLAADASLRPPRAPQTRRPPPARVAAIEAAAGGRLGVAVIDAGGDAAHRPSRRRALPDVLDLQGARRRRGAASGSTPALEQLDRRIACGAGRSARIRAGDQGACRRRRDEPRRPLRRGDPVERQHRRQSRCSKSIGGPAGRHRHSRARSAIAVTRLDRDEPTLNTAIPGDPRDTTSPIGDGAPTCSALILRRRAVARPRAASSKPG